MERNELYPIFLKVNQLNVLIVGGGKVGLEKLTFLLKSSPNANVVVLAKEFSAELLALTGKHQISTIKAPYSKLALKHKQLVISATDDRRVNKQIYFDSKSENILVNVADTPEYCDFYLGGIVTKGNLKIAISTNGKSPTMAKRMRQFLEELIPENVNELLDNLNKYRKTLKGDFEDKVHQMNEITKSLSKKTA